MRLIRDNFDSDESMEELLAKAIRLTETSASKANPKHLAQLELIHATRTTYPYKTGKEDLAKYIYLRKNGIPDAQADRLFSQLGRKLREHDIIPNDIIDHARELTEENTRRREELIKKVGTKAKVSLALHHH